MESSADSVNDGDENLVSGFDESTCSGDSVSEVFDNEDNIITEDSTILVNNNEEMFQGGLRIPFSDLPQDSNNLKLIWINTKRNKGF